jgi:hypothetical protein
MIYHRILSISTMEIVSSSSSSSSILLLFLMIYHRIFFFFFNIAAIFDDLSSNPLYLHHGDSLGSYIVVQPMNGDANPN